MGMLETYMRKVPEGMTAGEYVRQISDRISNDPEYDSADDWECYVLSPDQFDEAWEEQENLKNTDEVREKYRNLTNEGRVVFLQFDW